MAIRVVAEYAEWCQRLAMTSTDMPALLAADRWLAIWTTHHHFDDGGVS